MSVVFAQEALLLITEVPLLYREVPPLEMFHPMEQIVPPYGINCSTLWNILRVAFKDIETLHADVSVVICLL